MPQPRRLLVAADIGGPDRRHIGDEAMLESNIAALRARVRPLDVTLVSRDPADSASRYACRAVAPVPFDAAPHAACERRNTLDGLIAGAIAGRHELPVVEALAEADALVISGGGNLSSTWPDLLYERIALIELARVLRKPVAVLGQTIGPHLRDDEAALLGHALAGARFVGLRERASLALATRLGVPRTSQWYQCDDALFGSSPARSPAARNNVIAVTVDPQLRASPHVFDAFIAQLRELAARTAASLVIVPHAFGGEPSDATEASVLAERLGLPPDTIAFGLDAEPARAHAAQAQMVISTRYHPTVFALGAGVAALGIHADEYCRIKLRGALEHAGLERWSLAYDDVEAGELLPLALALWHRRDEVRRKILAHHPAWRRAERARWNAVLRALGIPIAWDPRDVFDAWRHRHRQHAFGAPRAS